MYQPAQVVIAQPAAVVYQQTVVVPSDPKDATRWRRGAITSIIFSLIAVGLLILGLILRRVLVIDLSIFGTSIDVEVDYYQASVSGNGQTNKLDMDDQTCGHGGLMRFAGALHYIALSKSILLTIFLGLELRSGVARRHIVLYFIISLMIVLGLYNGILAYVRSQANYNNCTTVLEGLIRYGVGSCWVCADAAFSSLILATIFYVSSRYCRCCCYSPQIGVAAGGYQQYQTVPQMGQPLMAAQPADMYNQQQQQHYAYGQQQQQYAQQAPAPSPYTTDSYAPKQV